MLYLFISHSRNMDFKVSWGPYCNMEIEPPTYIKEGKKKKKGA